MKNFINVFILMFLFVAVSPVYAARIVAVAESAYVTPPVAPLSRTESVNIANGDFFITAPTRGGTIGDGGDETTIWAMSFRKNSKKWDRFRADPSRMIKSAVLRITLTPRSVNGFLRSDAVRIQGLTPVKIAPALGGITPVSGVPLTIDIDLLSNGNTSEDLIRVLKFEQPKGILFMQYSDDAIVSYARLILKY